MARNYKLEYQNYQGTEEQKKNRAQRNTARRQATKAGLVHKGDGKDIDHKKPLSKGGSNSVSNRRVKSASANRSYARTKTGAIKSGK
jgi:hypothetical protein